MIIIIMVPVMMMYLLEYNGGPDIRTLTMGGRRGDNLCRLNTLPVACIASRVII